MHSWSMNQLYYNIATRNRKKYWLIAWLNGKNASRRKMLPRVAVHLGEAERKLTFAKLFKPLDLEKTTKQIFWKCLLIIAFEIRCILYASLKMFLNIVWSGLEPKDLTITAVGTKMSKFVSFRTPCCYVQVLSNSMAKWLLQLKQRIAVQPKRRC